MEVEGLYSEGQQNYAVALKCTFHESFDLACVNRFTRIEVMDANEERAMIVLAGVVY